MKPTLNPADLARAAFFALLPATAAGGAMGLPLLLSLAGLFAFTPSLFLQALEKKSIFLVLLATLSGWAALSSLWSPFEGPTSLKVVALLGLGLCFFAAAAANAKASRLTLSGASAAFFVLALLLGIEAALDMPLNRAIQPQTPWGELNRNPSRGLVVLLALTFPVIAWLCSQRRGAPIAMASAAALIGAVMSLQFGQISTAVGFGAGATLFGAALFAPRLSILVTSSGLAIWMLFAPFLTPLLVSNPQLANAVPMSWAHRIAIWRYTCERIMEQPWIGHGIDAGRATTEMISIRGMEMRGIPVHPHSASLQIWHDLGLVGALLAAALLAYGGWRLARTFAHDKLGGGAAAAVLAMFGLMANVGWSVWQEWWIATLLLAAALIAALSVRAARA